MIILYLTTVLLQPEDKRNTQDNNASVSNTANIPIYSLDELTAKALNKYSHNYIYVSVKYTGFMGSYIEQYSVTYGSIVTVYQRSKIIFVWCHITDS